MEGNGINCAESKRKTNNEWKKKNLNDDLFVMYLFLWYDQKPDTSIIELNNKKKNLFLSNKINDDEILNSSKRHRAQG